MAYGEGFPPEELEYTEFLFRIEDLVKEWFGTFRDSTLAPYGDDSAERLAVELVEQRLEETAMELALHLKARRLRREEGPEHLKGREEGAA